jgi:mRNA interferase RelE/StbE
VSTEPERYQIRFQPAAPRAIAERLPEAVAAAVLRFCEAALAVKRGYSLAGE